MRTTQVRKRRTLAKIPALILAGGLGTRLRSAVPDMPKVLAPVAGRPFLLHLLEQLADASLRNIILLTGYRGNEVEQTIGNRCGPLRIRYSQEKSPLGTGGALRQALDLISPHGGTASSTILLMNGDSHCGLDIDYLWRQHRRTRAELTMALAQVDDASRFGLVQMDGDDRVTGFIEKRATAGPGWINAGVYLLDREWIAEIPAGQPSSLERDWLPRWIERGRMFGHRSAGSFVDIGTPESYADAERFFETA